MKDFLKDFLFELTHDPNSSEGLILRAEYLEREALKLPEKDETREKYILYAACLRELAKKGLSPGENRKYIHKYLRRRGKI